MSSVAVPPFGTLTTVESVLPLSRMTPLGKVASTTSTVALPAGTVWLK